MGAGGRNHIDPRLHAFGMVNAEPGFTRFPSVISFTGMSTAQIGGGQHGRLPFDMPVEIDAKAALKS